jgi:hypothetical protein
VFEKLLELRQTLDGLFMCNAAKEGSQDAEETRDLDFTS